MDVSFGRSRERIIERQPAWMKILLYLSNSRFESDLAISANEIKTKTYKNICIYHIIVPVISDFCDVPPCTEDDEVQNREI